MTGYRHRRAVVHETYLAFDWPMKLLLATAMAGLLALSAIVPSISLPWTPVPFSLQLLVVLVSGAVLGRSWGLLSIVIYVVAGAVGIRVFAEQESAGSAILNPFSAAGYTSGYIYGWAAASYLVGWYVEKRRKLMDRRTTMWLAGGLGLLAIASLVTLTSRAFDGPRFTSQYSATQSYLWLFLAMTALAAIAAFVLVRRTRGLGWEKLNLWLVMMAAVAVIHLCGVVVFKFATGYTWPEAIALGSTVFLPFDLVKAALATSVTALFLPTREDESHFMSNKPVNP